MCGIEGEETYYRVQEPTACALCHSGSVSSIKVLALGHLFGLVAWPALARACLGLIRDDFPFTSIWRASSGCSRRCASIICSLGLFWMFQPSSQRLLPCSSTSTPTADLSQWTAHTSHMPCTLLASSSPPFLITSSLPAPI